MAIGMKIRQARKDAGLSQQKLAEAVGVKQGAVAAWEGGRNQTNPEMIKAIAITCGVTTDFLIGMPVNYNQLPDNIRELAEKMAALSPSDKAVMEKVLAAMLENGKEGEKQVIP